jgi:hypothetical protein
VEVSDKPLAERLQVKGDRRLGVIGASAALERMVGASKDGRRPAPPRH